MKRSLLLWIGWLSLALALLAGCAPAATAPPAQQPTQAAAATKVPAPTSAAAATRAPEATRAPTATPAPAVNTRTPQPSPAGTLPAPAASPTAPGKPVPTQQPTPPSEQRMIELEWPAALRLGESDLVRLSIVPYQGGYEVRAEFPEHTVQGQPVPVVRLAGYSLAAAARLDGVGFEIAPAAEVEQPLPENETVTWRWTLSPRAAGQQRLSIALDLRWIPEPGNPAAARQQTVFSRGLTVQVSSVLGLSRTQALTVGFVGLVLGAGLGAGALVVRPRPARALLRTLAPAAGLAIEPRPGITLGGEEAGLLQALFGRYARLALESEFLSGYSGARTFLALPVHPDGRADAYTIVKIGSRASIQREAEAYEHFVKDRLPPVTARIQQAPVTLPGSPRAAVRYTFIAEPGRLPTSLRLALLAQPDPALLWRLFDTFAPNWWMQRRAYSFRWGLEYDRLLPPHLVLEPATNSVRPARTLSEQLPPASLALQPGDWVWVKPFHHTERRADGVTHTLLGRPLPGQAELRVRWLSARLPAGGGGAARVVATRVALLSEWTAGVDRRGLPDPLAGLDDLLGQTVQGTQSIIHGDLNLENVLVGPGGFTWLIDFSETREGHPLSDFAHLAAEIVGHIYAPQFSAPAYQAQLTAGQLPLLSALEGIAGRCLFNPAAPSEYRTALRLACLGALKYPTLDVHAKELLYLTAAWSMS